MEVFPSRHSEQPTWCQLADSDKLGGRLHKCKKKHSKNCEIMEMFSIRSRPIMASRFYCEKCVLPPKNIHASLLTLAIESHFFLERNVVLNIGPGAFSSES